MAKDEMHSGEALRRIRTLIEQIEQTHTNRTMGGVPYNHPTVLENQAKRAEDLAELFQVLDRWMSGGSPWPGR